MDIRKNYYAILGVSPDATLGQIKAAFRVRAKKFHPDTTSLARRRSMTRFSDVSEAYKVLGNTRLRHVYDRRRRLARVDPKTEHVDLDANSTADGFTDLEVNALAEAAVGDLG